MPAICFDLVDVTILCVLVLPIVVSAKCYSPTSQVNKLLVLVIGGQTKVLNFFFESSKLFAIELNLEFHLVMNVVVSVCLNSIIRDLGALIIPRHEQLVEIVINLDRLEGPVITFVIWPFLDIERGIGIVKGVNAAVLVS